MSTTSSIQESLYPELTSLRQLFTTGPWLRPRPHRHNLKLNSYL